MRPDLNNHARIIAFVFRELAALCEEGKSSGDVDDAVCRILGETDADTCAEIARQAQAREGWQT